MGLAPQHEPLLHVCAEAEALRQEVQLLLSVWRFTQVPLQLVVPAAQHLPVWQELPPPHTVPHAPQLLLSVSGFTHAPAQAVSAQQLPWAQVVPAGQAALQPPQWALSV